MSDILDTVLLLALPASGKSEVRRYLAHLSPEECRRDFHMGPTVQLDDFPYVHLMRRIDDELAARRAPRVFFHAPDRPMQDPRDWGTLIHLLNEDYADLVARRPVRPASAGEYLFERIDAAAARVGVPARLVRIEAGLRRAVAEALEQEARALQDELMGRYPERLAGRTLVIEFARGGPQGSSLPLPAPLGYQYSLAQLAPAILERASILYVWVTPEESRRKNEARTDPNDPGSILHHGVPIEVMLNDYGLDDMDWLEAHSDRPGTVAVAAHGRTFHLPIGRFDNREDRTTFLRNPREAWRGEEIRGVHEGLRGALDRIAAQRRAGG
ncbi:MAG TPA: hypothetical protein VH877_01215 [Polyangia bacterium]|jgi:hypothetical protein|nr:hypothetical protein [Polyangia bacterium]